MTEPEPKYNLEAEAAIAANPELQRQLIEAFTDPSKRIRGRGRPRRHRSVDDDDAREGNDQLRAEAEALRHNAADLAEIRAVQADMRPLAPSDDLAEEDPEEAALAALVKSRADEPTHSMEEVRADLDRRTD